MNIARCLEEESAYDGPRERNVSLLASSAFGDVLVVSSDGSEVKYGSTKRPDMGLVDVGVAMVGVEKVEFNAAGDAALLFGPRWLGVIFSPPRSSDGAASSGDWSRRVLDDECRSEIIEAKWHAYADDHVVALDRSGQLRIWDVAEESRPRSAKCDAESVAFCFGSGNGWARFGILVLTQAGDLKSVCPWGPRRCAVPIKAARAMRHKLGRLEEEDAIKAEAWLSNVFEDDAFCSVLAEFFVGFDFVGGGDGGADAGDVWVVGGEEFLEGAVSVEVTGLAEVIAGGF